MEKLKSQVIEKGNPPRAQQAPPVKPPAEVKRRQAQSLLNLCVGTLGQHLYEIIDDLHLIAPLLPPTVKIQLVAIARRRGFLRDELLVPLTDESWELLDLSTSDVTDQGVKTIVEVCKMLKAVDVSRCNKLTAQSLQEFARHCPGLHTIRCGGTHMSNIAARMSLPCILPGLNVQKEVDESWEDVEVENVGTGAPSLRWIVWPSIDDNSKEFISTQCPKVVINPAPAKKSSVFKQAQVPREALIDTTLDEVFVEDISPSSWESRASTAAAATSQNSGDGLSLAERFRLAFVARDERLASKRAKNLRQKQRRAEKYWLNSDAGARARHLASTVHV